jgi:hypothetical protein
MSDNFNIFEEEKSNQDRLLNLFLEPGLYGLIGDANSAKSNTIYFIIQEFMKKYDFELYTYGLRMDILGATKIHQVAQLERIRDSFIIIDEFTSLMDVENRKIRNQIEASLRLIYHNNNRLLLSGLPENYKKFLSSKLQAVIFKRCLLADLINGSRAKELAVTYKGYELGSAVLDVPQNKALVYDGNFYYNVEIPYIPAGDSKAKNKNIFVEKSQMYDDSLLKPNEEIQNNKGE